MNRSAARVRGLEQARRAEDPARKSDRPWWWELPPEEWRTGRVGLGHEEALAELDADPRPLPDDPGFSDEELDAEWARLTGAWSEGR